jgi:hypothetical protein
MYLERIILLQKKLKLYVAGGSQGPKFKSRYCQKLTIHDNPSSWLPLNHRALSMTKTCTLYRTSDQCLLVCLNIIQKLPLLCVYICEYMSTRMYLQQVLSLLHRPQGTLRCSQQELYPWVSTWAQRLSLCTDWEQGSGEEGDEQALFWLFT